MTLIRNFSIDDYHRGEAVSKSQLDALDKSAFHFWSLHRDPNRPTNRVSNPAFALGSMTHTAILEPHDFDHRHVLAPVCDRRTKEGKAVWAEFVAGLMPGQEAADPVMRSQALAMSESLRTVPILRHLLSAGEAEISAYWTDPDSQVACRCRPDWVVEDGDGVWILDIKTARDASPEGFAKAILNYGYAKQDGFYSDGFAAASGKRVKGFIFGTVETTWPHAAAAYQLTEEDRAWGKNLYRVNLATYAECMRTNIWPGYTNGQIQTLQLPAWATNNHEEIEIGYKE